jgi:hypothetical protein
MLSVNYMLGQPCAQSSYTVIHMLYQIIGQQHALVNHMIGQSLLINHMLGELHAWKTTKCLVNGQPHS